MEGTVVAILHSMGTGLLTTTCPANALCAPLGPAPCCRPCSTPATTESGSLPVDEPSTKGQGVHAVSTASNELWSEETAEAVEVVEEEPEAEDATRRNSK